MMASICDNDTWASRRFGGGTFAVTWFRAVRRTCLALVLAVFACAGMLTAAVVAPQVAAAAPRGSVSLSVVAEDARGSHRLVGDTFTLVRVATAQVYDGGNGQSAGVAYTMAAGFARYDRDWASLAASDVAAAARELAQAARDAGSLDAGVSQRVSEGARRLTFSGLDSGLYLVVRTGVADANKGLTCDPVLVSVPQLEDGAFAYDVDVDPKFEWADVDHPGGNGGGAEPDRGTPGWLPTTGDYVIGVVCLLVAGGSIAVLIGRRLREKRA